MNERLARVQQYSNDPLGCQHLLTAKVMRGTASIHEQPHAHLPPYLSACNEIAKNRRFSTSALNVVVVFLYRRFEGWCCPLNERNGLRSRGTRAYFAYAEQTNPLRRNQC